MKCLRSFVHVLVCYSFHYCYTRLIHHQNEPFPITFCNVPFWLVKAINFNNAFNILLHKILCQTKMLNPFKFIKARVPVHLFYARRQLLELKKKRKYKTANNHKIQTWRWRSLLALINQFFLSFSSYMGNSIRWFVLVSLAYIIFVCDPTSHI